MKHTVSILELEISKCEMSIARLERIGDSPRQIEYFKELVKDYSDSLKILTERPFEDVEFYCEYEEAKEGNTRCSGQCDRCNAVQRIF
jgi:hypothetical protein